jgi:hypothetical protein
VARDGRAAAPAARLVGGAADRTRGQPGHHGRGERPLRHGDHEPRPTVTARQRFDPERLLDAEPRRQAPGRRRDWQAAQAALERLAGWSRQRHHRDQPHPDRAAREQPGRRLDLTVGRQERDGR